MKRHWLMIGALLMLGCDAQQSRGTDNSCEEKLREVLPHWHSQVKAAAKQVQQLSKASTPDSVAITRANTALQLSIWAASSAETAHLRHRIYGGDVSRNKAKQMDATAAQQRAVDAAQVALQFLEGAAPALKAAVSTTEQVCR